MKKHNWSFKISSSALLDGADEHADRNCVLRALSLYKNKPYKNINQHMSFSGGEIYSRETGKEWLELDTMAMYKKFGLFYTRCKNTSDAPAECIIKIYWYDENQKYSPSGHFAYKNQNTIYDNRECIDAFKTKKWIMDGYYQ